MIMRGAVDYKNDIKTNTYLTRFRLFSHPFKIPTELSQTMGILSPHTHTHGNPHENLHTMHFSPVALSFPAVAHCRSH